MYEFKYDIWDTDNVRRTIETEAPKEVVDDVVNLVVKFSKPFNIIMDILRSFGFKTEFLVTTGTYNLNEPLIITKRNPLVNHVPTEKEELILIV